MTSSRPVRLSALVLRFAPLLMLILVAGVFSFLSPRFLMHDNLQAILTQSSWLVAVALGVNFALLTGGVDLSAGSIMYVSAVAIGLAFGQVPALIALPAAAVIGIVYGTLNGVLVVRFGVPAFIVTLATAFVGRGLGLYLSSTQVVLAGSAIADLGRARLGLPAPLWIAIAAFGVAWVLLRALPFGRYVLAAGADLAGARRAGVPVGPVLIGVYMISGFFAGIGGFISFSQTSAASAAFGQGAEFLSIAAAVLGGTSLFGGRGSLYAPVLGAVLIQTVQNGLVLLDVNPYAQPLITGAIIFAAALLDSMRLRLATYFDRRSDIAR